MMLSSRVFFIAIFCSGVVLSQETLVDVESIIPTCAATCYDSVLAPTNCQTTDLRTCFCTNSTLQIKVGLCIVASCNATDQFVSSTLSQTEICNGVPQKSRKAEVVRGYAILAVLVFPIIALRFISRALIARRIWWDDWTILMAAIFMVPNSAIPIYLTTLGFGEHFYNVPAQNFALISKLLYIISLFYIAIQNLIKISILLLYKRIFPMPNFHKILHICLAWIATHTIIFMFASAFHCLPVASLWDESLPKKCINSTLMIYFGAGFTIFEDIVLVALPIYELRFLTSMDMKKKFALAFLFTMGCLACTASMVRLKYVVAFGLSADATYDDVDLVIWSAIEVYLAAVCACIICLHPVLVKCYRAIFSPRVPMREINNEVPTIGQGAKKNKPRGIELMSEDDHPQRSAGSQHKRGMSSKGSEIGHELCSVKTEGRESCEFVERGMSSETNLNGCSRV